MEDEELVGKTVTRGSVTINDVTSAINGGEVPFPDAPETLNSRSGRPTSDKDVKALLKGLESARTNIAEAIRTIQSQTDSQLSGEAIRTIQSQTDRQLSGEAVCQIASETPRKKTSQLSVYGQVAPLGSITAVVQYSQRRATQQNISEAWQSEVCSEMGEGSAARLPAHWPSSLRVRRICIPSDVTRHDSMAAALSRTLPRRDQSERRGSKTSSEDPSLLEVKSKRCTQCIREPDSAMDQVGFLVLFYDLAVMPVVLAWDLPFEGPLVIMAWLSLVFWLADLVLSFVTGYFEDGELNMDMRDAVWRYLRTWFLLDFLVVLCDLLSFVLLMFAGSDNSSRMSLRVMRFAKLSRIFRVTGLLRIFRAMRALEGVVEKHIAELRTAFQVMCIAIFWLWMNHILACIWYVVGLSAPSDTGARWVESPFLPDLEDFQYKDSGKLFQYATAIHWSIAQTTLGAMEIVCVNAAERFFTVACLLIGLFLGSSLISSLSASMVEFRMSTRKKSHTLSTLRRYLRENNVNKKVALLVQRQAAARLSDTGMLTAEDVPALATLATGIRHKLHTEICQPHLHKHQLFQLWHHLDSSWFPQFCFKAVDMKFLRPEDDLFLGGSEASAAYFTVSGVMEYTQLPESSPVLHTTQRTVEHGTWLGESALWVHWIHVGRMEAVTRCQVLAIQLEAFTLSMHEHYSMRTISAEYGRIFAERIGAAKPPHLPWPDDLGVPFADFGDIVVTMSEHMHLTIGNLALEHCKNGLIGVWNNRQANKDLRQEVEDGRSIVILSLAGELVRVVSISVAHIVRDDGRVFVTIAKWRNGQVEPIMKLPATKCRRNESSDEAFQRLLRTTVAPLADGIEVTGVEREMASEYSARLGVCTTSRRKLFFATFSGALLAPVCRRDEEGARQEGLRTATVSRHMEIFEDLPVYYISRGEVGFFCAWLRDTDHQHLPALNNSPPVRRWLATLRPPDSIETDMPHLCESW